jgi:hypothetical protein
MNKIPIIKRFRVKISKLDGSKPRRASDELARFYNNYLAPACSIDAKRTAKGHQCPNEDITRVILGSSWLEACTFKLHIWVRETTAPWEELQEAISDLLCGSNLALILMRILAAMSNIGRWLICGRRTVSPLPPKYGWSVMRVLFLTLFNLP